MEDALLLGSLSVLLVGAAAYRLGWVIHPPGGVVWADLPGWRLLLGWSLHQIGWPWALTIGDRPFPDFITAVGHVAGGPAFLQAWHGLIWLSLGLGAFSGVGVAGLLLRSPAAVIHDEGRSIVTSRRQAARDLRPEIELSGQGLEIAPGVPISLGRETRHLLILGSTGGGKTQLITPLIQQALARGDKLLVYDNKGDFTQMFPEALLLAPWDARSPAWDVGRDCRTRGDARALAGRLIPDSADPVWAEGARSILTGLLVSLQAAHGIEWGWSDLARAVSLPLPEIRQQLSQYHPEAQGAVEEGSKTSQSLLITLTAQMAPVFDLAAAWGKTKSRFSLSDWLADPNPPHRAVILQGNGQLPELQRAYIQGMLALLAGRVNSPALPDSRSRRIWLFLDEMPQLGRIPEIWPLAEIGRSKGLRLVLGMQDIAQLRAIYGHDPVAALTSMVGTTLITRLGGTETARWVSDLIGQRTVWRLSTGHSDSPGGAGTSMQYVKETEQLIRPEALSHDLGERRRGIEALLHTNGTAVYRLIWPYMKLPTQRPAHVPAAWLQDASRSAPAALAPAVGLADAFGSKATPSITVSGVPDAPARSAVAHQAGAVASEPAATGSPMPPMSVPASTAPRRRFVRRQTRESSSDALD